MKSPGIVVLGGINMDLVTFSARMPQAGETVVGDRFVTYAGGKGANQAVAAARMGAGAVMVGRVGDDMFGPQLTQGLADAGVDVTHVGITRGENSGIAVISVDGSAQNRIIQVLGANSTCGDEEEAAVEASLAGAEVLMLQLEVSVELSLRAAREAASQGKLVVLDPGPVRPFPQEMYAYCSVITPNETEAEALVGFAVTGPQDAERAADALLGRGAGIAVIKLGAQGAYYASRNTRGYVPPFTVEATDSVAAGDAFNAALAVCLANGNLLEQAVTVAAAAGALAVTTTGAQDSMPSLTAVEELIVAQSRWPGA